MGEEDDHDSTLGNIITDKDQKTPLDNLSQLNRHENLHDILDKLKPRAKVILQLRFGLNNENCHTLESIGVKFNLTRERIRQIEKVALKKLRVLMIERDEIKACR